MKNLFAGGAFALAALVMPATASTVVVSQMVKDIATGRGYAGSAPRDFLSDGDRFYFSAETPLAGRELYVSDGTNARLLDLVPGTGSSHALALGVSNGRVIVDADDAAAGEQITAVDAQTGSSVALLNFGGPLQPGYPRATRVGQVGTRTLFELVRTTREFWATDGTPGGTVQLPQARYGNTPSVHCSLGDRALFVGSDGKSIWRTDGTIAGTTLVAPMAQEAFVVKSARGGNACYFMFHRGSGWSLWRSDGNGVTVAGLQSSGTPVSLAATATAAFVADWSPTSRVRLWTSATVQPVAVIASTGAAVLHAVGSRVVLLTGVLENGQTVDAVYLSDGTATGTQRLTTPAGFRAGIDDRCGRALGAALVLGCVNGMWRVDAATGAVTSFAAESGMFQVHDMVALGGVLVGAASAPDWIDGAEVWRTDGTTTGTRELHDIWQKNQSAFFNGVYPLAVNGNRLFFGGVLDPAHPGSTGGTLWRSDGTEAGTFEFPGALYNGGRVDSLAPFGDGVLFNSQLNSSAEHYRSNGMPGNATRVVDRTYFNLVRSSEDKQAALLSCDVGTSYWDLCGMRAEDAQAALVLPRGEYQGRVEVVGGLDDKLLFYISDFSATEDRRGLWRSDGTALGTVRIVPDLQPANLHGTPSPVSLADSSRIWFDGTVHGSGGQRGLYVSDLTAAGTRLVAALPAVVTSFARLGSHRIALIAGEQNSQLWVSDGTSSGTQLLRTFTGSRIDAIETVGGRVHFIVGRQNGTDYYVSDGTKGGTVVAEVPAGLRVTASESPRAVDDDTALFTCHAPAIGEELCAIDADGSHPRLVQDIFPGPESSQVMFLDRTGDAVYFIADDGYHGRELWRVPVDRLFLDGFDATSR